MTLVLQLNVVINELTVFETLSILVAVSEVCYIYRRKDKKRAKDKTAKNGKPTKDKIN